jgi:hypothetical protein
MAWGIETAVDARAKGKEKAQGDPHEPKRIARRFYITVQDLHAIKVLRAPRATMETASE